MNGLNFFGRDSMGPASKTGNYSLATNPDFDLVALNAMTNSDCRLR